MPTTRHKPVLAASLLAMAVAAPSFADPRRGLESVHQPQVTNGVAHVPGCPNWTDSERHPSEAQSFNFGCATASNLAAMIADPADLVHGHQAPGPDAETAMKAIKAWRAMVPTGAGGIEKVSSKDR